MTMAFGCRNLIFHLMVSNSRQEGHHIYDLNRAYLKYPVKDASIGLNSAGPVALYFESNKGQPTISEQAASLFSYRVSVTMVRLSNSLALSRRPQDPPIFVHTSYFRPFQTVVQIWLATIPCPYLYPS